MPSAIVPLAFLSILIFMALLWRRELFLLLPFVAILNGVPLSISGLQVRIDQIVACLLVIPLTTAIISGRRSLRMDATAWWLAALFAANVAASVMNSPSRMYSLSQCANLASAWVIYLLVINFIDSREELARCFERCLWAAMIAGCVGILAFLLAIAGLSIGGAEVSASAAVNLTKPYGAYGTMVEPNIFGSFTGAMMVAALTILAASAHEMSSRTTRLLRWTAALCAAGLVLSFTRSAWLAAIVALLFVALVGRRSLGVRTTHLLVPPLIGIVIVVALLLLPGSAGTFLRFKLANLVNLESPTAALRLLTYSLALKQTLVHPIVGLGTYSFAPLLAEGNDFARFEGWRGLWIGNYLLLALHDTGVIGLLIWAGLAWSIVARGIRVARATMNVDPVFGARTLALTGAIVSLLVAFLATTGFSLGYPWLLIGLLGAHVRLAEREDPAPVETSLEEELAPSHLADVT
jgi:O-antigen ligase